MTKTEPPKEPAHWFDRHFQSLVMALMLCIITSLSVLWLQERNRRIDTEMQLSETINTLVAMQVLLERQLPVSFFDHPDTEDSEENR